MIEVQLGKEISVHDKQKFEVGRIALFLLKPAGKDYLWGGNRLERRFFKGIDLKPLAETWECSDHPDGPSRVASREHTGALLADVLKNASVLSGHAPDGTDGLPILIKLIDAKRDLSVQVHPDDTYAREQEHEPRGKSEMWYVLDAAKDASLVYGFRHDMMKSDLEESLRKGTVEKYLQKVPVQRDDVFLHQGRDRARHRGRVLIAEIQESSTSRIGCMITTGWLKTAIPGNCISKNHWLWRT